MTVDREQGRGRLRVLGYGHGWVPNVDLVNPMDPNHTDYYWAFILMGLSEVTYSVLGHGSRSFGQVIEPGN